MKIIDPKGRLFGIINIIDLSIILVLIVFGYISFNLARNAKLGYPIEIEIKALFPSLPLEIVEKLQPGDMENNRYGHSRLIRFEIKGKNNDRFGDIYAWLNLSVRVKDVPVGNRGKQVSSFFLRGQELNIDDPIIFTTSKYSIRGTILNIGGMEREIEVVLRDDIPKEVTDLVRVGDIVLRFEHMVGEVIAKEYTPDRRVKVRLHIKRGEVSLNPGKDFCFDTERYSAYGIIIKSQPWIED